MAEMNNEMQEYVTFNVTSKDGADIEMAVVDEFDYEHKHYVVAAVVKDDTVLEDEGVYIYKCKMKDDTFEVEPITSAAEFEEISNAYAAMDESAE